VKDNREGRAEPRGGKEESQMYAAEMTRRRRPLSRSYYSLMQRGMIALAASLVIASNSLAQDYVDDDEEMLDPIVVTATRTETPASHTGSSVSVITADEIKSSLQSTVTEVLASVPALDVVRTGSYGSATSIFVRGASSGGTLVLIDGIELSDPSGMGRAPDIDHLTLDNVARIEVVRGPQSTLYGSDALGGVVNIITKKGDGPPSGSVTLEGGSHSSYREALTAQGGMGAFDYSVSLSRFDTDGISSADEAFGNTEKDGYSNTTFGGSFGFSLSDKVDLGVLVRYVDVDMDIDDGAGAGGDDPDHVYLVEQFVAGTKATFGLSDDRWRHSVGLSVTDFHRDDIDPGESTSYFDGQMLKGDWQGTFAINDANKLTFGIEHELEKGESTWATETDAQTTGLFVQDQMKLGERVFATVGARVDSHSEFGTHATGRAALAYAPMGKGTRISASLGTGFKAPALSELSMNPGLDPEELLAFDVGLEQRFRDDDLVLGVSLFHNDFENQIAWDDVGFTYYNTGEADAQGVEFAASFKTEFGLSVKATYTYTDATEDGAVAIRRAPHKATLRIGYRAPRGAEFGLSVAYVGETDDKDFSPPWPAPPLDVKLESYTLVGLTASCRIKEKLDIFCRVDNLFDEAYTQAYGYGTPGTTVRLGTKIAF